MSHFQFVGVDVSKDKFDVATDNLTSQIFTMDSAGFKKFTSFLLKQAPNAWVCMEATGHYSEVLAEYLYEQGVKVSVVNPLQIKNFARSKLVRNKTDALDAKVIADFCKHMQPREFQPRLQAQKELGDLIKLLDTLKAQLVQLKNQLHSTRGAIAKEEIKKAIASLKKKIKRIEDSATSLTKDQPDLHEKVTLLCSIKGIGILTSLKILAFTPDIAQFANAKQFAAFIGLTPKQFQSGRYIGKAVISRLGNPFLRKSLFMAALVAKRYNSRFQLFAKEMTSLGKAPKVIICAIMRKLAHVIFGVLKHETPYNDDLVLNGA